MWLARACYLFLSVVFASVSETRPEPEAATITQLALSTDDQCSGSGPCALAALQIGATGRSNLQSTPVAATGDAQRGCSGGKCDCANEFFDAFESVDRESPSFATDVQKALEAAMADGSAKAAACSRKLKDALEPRSTHGGYGVNSKTGWEYSLVDDCFKNGGTCPEGQFCQTFSREQWFPYAESYINRGRCVPWLTEGSLCTGESEDLDMFGQLESWAGPPLICGPNLACAKDIPAYPGPMCVKKKSQVYPCGQAWPYCGGRPTPEMKEGELDWQKWGESAACASNLTCRTPTSGGFTRGMMEACASKYLVHGLNGENYAFLGTGGSTEALGARSATMGSIQDELEHYMLTDEGLMDDRSKTVVVGMLDMSIMNKTKIANFLNAALAPLWPFPVCDSAQSGHVHGQATRCTTFPLKPITEEESQMHLGRHPSSYFCMWGVAHTIFENGGPDLSEEQIHAGRVLIRMYAEAHSCQVCRTNFQHLVEKFGYPTSKLRDDHAEWWWKAHNAANEHVYSVHSYPSPLAPRVGDFANPEHMSAWFTPRKVARETWKIRDFS